MDFNGHAVFFSDLIAKHVEPFLYFNTVRSLFGQLWIQSKRAKSKVSSGLQKEKEDDHICKRAEYNQVANEFIDHDVLE